MNEASSAADIRACETLALLGRLLESSVNRALQQFDITWEGYAILSHLQRSPRKFLHMTELATQLGFSRSRVSRPSPARSSAESSPARRAPETHERPTRRSPIRAPSCSAGSAASTSTVRDSLTRFHVRAEQLEVLVQHLQPLVDHVNRPLALSACTRRQRPASLDALPHSTGHR
ncbi:hypothetical protein ACFY8N_37520 [Streptomyces collinus]|uniref:hypothetical protein n=1 Tax=Streptomyces collinus TaxID=42684 RepID=UPI0036760A9D